MDLTYSSRTSAVESVSAPRFSVSEFTNGVKNLLEEHYPRFQIYGEISNLKKQASGHYYFALKDRHSQVSAVLFRGDALRNELQLKDGLEVLIEGAVSVYAPRGNYQIIVRRIRELGKGALQEQFERLKQKLSQEGLFAPERKRALPMLPQRIGIITSPTGAVIRDFVSILRRLQWNGTVRVFPSRVQGKEGLPDLIDALGKANDSVHQLDLLVIARGGGSLEDLWNFNEEQLVRGIAASRLPVISAIGHETDFTLADFVADYRAETPSAAAEKIASGLVEYRQRFEQLNRRFKLELKRGILEKQGQLDTVQQRLQRVAPQRRVEEYYQRLDDLQEAIQRRIQQRIELLRERLEQLSSRQERASPRHRLQEWTQKLNEREQRLFRAAHRYLQLPAERLLTIEKRLLQVGPEVALKRGFSLLETEEGKLITQAAEIEIGQELKIRLQDGLVSVKVLKKHTQS